MMAHRHQVGSLANNNTATSIFSPSSSLAKLGKVKIQPAPWWVSPIFHSV